MATTSWETRLYLRGGGFAFFTGAHGRPVIFSARFLSAKAPPCDVSDATTRARLFIKTKGRGAGEKEKGRERGRELTLRSIGAISGCMGTSFGRCLRLIINNQSLGSYESACRLLMRGMDTLMSRGLWNINARARTTRGS